MSVKHLCKPGGGQFSDPVISGQAVTCKCCGRGALVIGLLTYSMHARYRCIRAAHTWKHPGFFGFCISTEVCCRMKHFAFELG